MEGHLPSNYGLIWFGCLKMNTLGKEVRAVSKSQPALFQEQTWEAHTFQVATGWLTKAYKEPGVENDTD